MSRKTDASGLKKDVNEVAETENWRAACTKELKLSNSFDEVWGFLKVPGEATSVSLHHSRMACTVVTAAGQHQNKSGLPCAAAHQASSVT